MILLGILCLVLGWVFGISLLWVAGIVLVAVGGVLYLLGAAGRSVGPRRHYW